MRDRNREQYENDPAFRSIADMAFHAMAQGSLTAEELRRAVMFGAMRYEMENLRPVTLVRDASGDPNVQWPDFDYSKLPEPGDIRDGRTVHAVNRELGSFASCTDSKAHSVCVKCIKTVLPRTKP